VNSKIHSIKTVCILFIWLMLLSISCAIGKESDQAVDLPGKHQIRMDSFNIEKLGRDDPYQTVNVAVILKNYDIVAVQEVMNIGATGANNQRGAKGIRALRQIVADLDVDWDLVLSSEPNGTENAEITGNFHTFEYYAFIFRKSKIELIPNSAFLWDEEANPILGLEDQERQFDREPFIASFKIKDGMLDFTLITFHAASPSARWRKDEIERLGFVYENVQRSDPNQHDVFLLGDFNTAVDKKEWKVLKGLPTIKHILTSLDKTTIYKAEGRPSKNQYDTIWYQGFASDEDIIVETAQVHPAWEEEDLVWPADISPPARISTPENKLIWFYGKYVSDHLPITVVLYTDKDTDNFGNTLSFLGELMPASEDIARVIVVIVCIVVLVCLLRFIPALSDALLSILSFPLALLAYGIAMLIRRSSRR